MKFKIEKIQMFSAKKNVGHWRACFTQQLIDNWSLVAQFDADRKQYNNKRDEEEHLKWIIVFLRALHRKKYS